MSKFQTSPTGKNSVFRDVLRTKTATSTHVMCRLFLYFSAFKRKLDTRTDGDNTPIVNLDSFHLFRIA